MIRWLARLLLFRILPRRVLPILTLIEVAGWLRAARNQRRASAAARADHAARAARVAR